MRYKEMMRDLEQEKIASAYLFEGEEDYLKEEALKRLKEIIIPDYEDFNYEVFSAPDTSGYRIVESASVLPFRGRKRLVVIKEADKLSGPSQEILSKYLEKAVESTCLVCLGEKFDKRRKFYQAFLKKGKVVFFHHLGDSELMDWIEERVERKGKKITPEAAVYLKDRIGNNLHSLNQEIEKLLLFIYPKSSIEKEDVAEAVGEGGVGIFDLTKAVRERDLSKALSILSYLWEKGEEPMRIHSLIAREIRILLRIKGKGEITSPQACSIIFGRRSYYSSFYTDIASEYMEAAKKFTLPELISDYQYLVKAEASIKTGREEPEVAMERMILNLLEEEVRIIPLPLTVSNQEKY